MNEERTTTESQVLIVTILEIMNKVGTKWKYKVSDNRSRKFIMQTTIEPRELPVTLKIGKKYLFPIVMNKSGKVGNVDGQYMELIENYDEDGVIKSIIPLEEQGGTKEHIAKITEGDQPVMDSTLLDHPPIPKPTTNDKPSVERFVKSDSVKDSHREGSQLVVPEVYDGEIIKSPASLLAYLPPIKEAKEYFDYIQEFKKSILDKSDIQVIGKNTHICRSGWEKFVNVFRLDHWIVSTKKEITRQHLQSFKWDKSVQPWIKIPDRDEWLDGIQYTVIVGMKSLTGSVTQGIGLVQQYEGGRDDRKEHDIIAHAETRAFNRACSKIVGLGEVSAEEIQ